MINTFDSKNKFLFEKTRGQYGVFAPEIAKTIAKKTNNIDRRHFEFLVLGCHNGKNDVIPLVESLVNDTNTYSITCIDTSDAINELKDYTPPPNIKLNIYKEDIENYSEEIFIGGKYDIIISFFTLYHLINWLYCAYKIKQSLKLNGYFYTILYNDLKIYLVENNFEKISPNISPLYNYNSFFKSFFENEKFKKKWLIYGNRLKGSNVDSLLQFLSNSFCYEKDSFEYEDYINIESIKNIFRKESQHSSILWGLSEVEADTMEIELEKQIELITNDKLPFKGELILYEFRRYK